MKTAKTIKNNQNLTLTVRISEQVFCGLLFRGMQKTNKKLKLNTDNCT